MNTYMNAFLNANAPAVDNRLSGATRYSGDPADADIFLLRFSSTAQQLDFSPVYDGTERHSAPPNNQAAVLAMPETTWHERTETRSNSPTLRQALDGPDADQWRDAMVKEVEQLVAMHCWDIEELPEGASEI